jgi:hypothetical protein
VGSEDDRAQILKRYPLISDKLYLEWDGKGDRVLSELRKRLK